MKPFSAKPYMAVMVIALFFITSCGKEADSLNNIKAPKSGSVGPHLFNDILGFDSFGSCAAYLEALDEGNEVYVAEYLAENHGLNNENFGEFGDKQLEAIDEAVNANMDRYYVYRQAEENLSFTSLRSVVEPLELAYMATGKDEDDPFNVYPYTVAYQSVLNPYREIMIGDQIYKDIEDGTVQIVVTDGSYETIQAIRSDEAAAYTLPNVEVVYDVKNAVVCKSTKKNSDYKDYNKAGKIYRIKTYCHIYTWQLNAVTNHYRKWGSGALTWSIAPIKTGVYGDEIYRNKPCSLTSEQLYKEKEEINWSRQEVSVYSSGGGLFHTPTQKTYSQSFWPTANTWTSQYISVYAW